MKNYASVAAAKKGIERAGLHGLTVDYNIVRFGKLAGRVEPVVHVELAEDFDEVTARGFHTKLTPVQEG